MVDINNEVFVHPLTLTHLFIHWSNHSFIHWLLTVLIVGDTEMNQIQGFLLEGEESSMEINTSQKIPHSGVGAAQVSV
jgi:hypothetical protein